MADRQALEQACTRFLSFDVYEESRAPYLARLIDLTGEREHFRRLILHCLTAETEKDIEWSQVVGLARCWVDLEMIRAIYAMFDRIGIREAGIYVLDDLIAVDGIAGFRYAIRTALAANLTGNDDLQRFSSVCETATERLGIRADEIDSAVRTILDRSATEPPPRSTGIELPRHAGEAQIRAFLAAADERKAETAVLRFRRRFEPWDLDLLMELAESDPRPRIRRASVWALQERRSPRIRHLARRLWQDPSRRQDAAKLLVSCPDARDVMLLDAYIRALDGQDEDIHGMGFSIVQLVEHDRRMPGSAKALQYLYEAGPCSTCRSHVVELLNRNRWLPDAWRQECRFDSNPQTAREARPRYGGRKVKKR